MTEDEVRALMTRLLRTRNPIRLSEFEFGWVAREELSEEERASGRHVGQGRFIVDRTGVVTVHSSLPARLILQQYVQARRQGRFTGRQVWPKEDQPDRPMSTSR